MPAKRHDKITAGGAVLARLKAVGVGNDCHLSVTVAAPHLERVLEGADLIDHDPARLRFRFGQKNASRRRGENIIGFGCGNQIRQIRSEPAFAAPRRTGNQIGVPETAAFVGSTQVFECARAGESHG